MTEHNGNKHDSMRSASEKLLEATRKTLHSATFKANQYKRIVQKKIDVNAVQKKIATAHTDLGKLIDDMREAGDKNILNKAEVRELFSQIDTLKHTAATLLEEIETIRNEECSEDETHSSGGESNLPH